MTLVARSLPRVSSMQMVRIVLNAVCAEPASGHRKWPRASIGERRHACRLPGFDRGWFVRRAFLT